MIMALSLALPLVVSAEVFQCKEDGKSTFQQTPCENETEVKCDPSVDYAQNGDQLTSSLKNKYCYKKQVRLEKKENKQIETQLSQQKNALDKKSRSKYKKNKEEYLDKALASIELGMTRLDFGLAWGEFYPFRKYYDGDVKISSNKTKSIYGNREQVVLKIYSRTRYLYFDENILTSISD